jgi:NADP-dependent 3-hydroxy acid dehydrogenase YdfG
MIVASGLLVRHEGSRSTLVLGRGTFTMAHGLTGKVALVTGAARGIGRAIALRLAQDRAAVVVNYSGSTQQAQETAGLIEQCGGQAIAVQADVSKVDDVKRLFDACFEKFGKLDILVNNAGVMFTKPVVEVGEEEFDRLFAVNVKGAFFCCQEAAKRMAEGGRIINLSSSTTALMLPGYAANVATKGAVEQSQDIADVVAMLAGEDFRWITGPIANWPLVLHVRNDSAPANVILRFG